jgi:prophage regulatory protein
MVEPSKITGRKLLSYDDLRARGIRFSRVHLARLEREGLFPQRIRFGAGNFIAWLEDEIDRFLEDRAAARPVVARPSAACRPKDEDYQHA